MRHTLDILSHMRCMRADPESGIAGYTVGIGTEFDKMNITQTFLPTAETTVVLNVPVTSLNMHQVYYATVVAENSVGSTTSASSDGFMTTNATNAHSCVAIA